MLDALALARQVIHFVTKSRSFVTNAVLNVGPGR